MCVHCSKAGCMTQRMFLKCNKTAQRMFLKCNKTMAFFFVLLRRRYRSSFPSILELMFGTGTEYVNISVSNSSLLHLSPNISASLNTPSSLLPTVSVGLKKKKLRKIPLFVFYIWDIQRILEHVEESFQLQIVQIT